MSAEHKSFDGLGDMLSYSELDPTTIGYRVESQHLDMDSASRVFKRIKADMKSRQELREVVLDLSSLEKADPLALSLIPALKNLCAATGKNFLFLGLSEEMRQEMIRHSSFKGHILPAKPHHASVTERIEHLGDISLDIGEHCVSMITHIGDFAAEIVNAIKHPGKIRWRETLYYMDICGSDALPIVSVICFLMGLILGFQGSIQMHKFGTDIFLADAVGLIIIKEMGPLMVAMIATGRAGSAFAAEIGTMKVAEEIDALVTFGFVPSRFLFIPKLIAMVVSAPLLTVFGDFIGILGGMTVGYFKLGIPITAYANRTLTVLNATHLAESLVKSLVFAVVITVVGCVRGFESDNDAQGVGRSATSAVVTSILMIVLADTLLTTLFSMSHG